MDSKTAAANELSQKASEASSRTVLAGFDGFVDVILRPVDRRYGPGDDYEEISNIDTFGKRICAAAGKSTNIELAKRLEKIGGNGPILANAMVEAGFSTRYVGAIGTPEPHPVFTEFAKRTDAISIANPGVTNAVEFNDGKILLGIMDSLEEVTYANILEKVGEGAFFDLVSRTDLFALVNWVMLPYMTKVLQSMVEKVFPNLGPRDHRRFFFDLCDPEKRSDDDLLALLHLLKKFSAFGSSILGLNLKEAQHVARVLGQQSGNESEEDLREMARSIRAELQIDCVVIHPTDAAACATKDDTFFTEGFFTPNPRITTGAGDHFNAGFCAALTLGLSPLSSLIVGNAFSGSYVRKAESPSLSEVSSFIRSTEFSRIP